MYHVWFRTKNNMGNKPEAIPAADPAALSDSFLRPPLSSRAPTPLATDVPISTLGPSGPKEFPVPNVTQAAIVFKTGSNTDLTDDVQLPSVETSRVARKAFKKLTTKPPQAGTKITRCQCTPMGSSEAARYGIPSQQRSRIS